MSTIYKTAAAVVGKKKKSRLVCTKILETAIKQQPGSKTSASSYLFHVLGQQGAGVRSFPSTSWSPPLCVSIYRAPDCLWPQQTEEDLMQTRQMINLLYILSLFTLILSPSPFFFLFLSLSLCCQYLSTLSYPPSVAPSLLLSTLGRWRWITQCLSAVVSQNENVSSAVSHNKCFHLCYCSRS